MRQYLVSRKPWMPCCRLGEAKVRGPLLRCARFAGAFVVTAVAGQFSIVVEIRYISDLPVHRRREYIRRPDHCRSTQAKDTQATAAIQINHEKTLLAHATAGGAIGILVTALHHRKMQYWPL